MAKRWIPLIGALCLCVNSGYGQIPAFPGAEGFGSTTPGGRGGTVIEVTTLAPTGAGSFLNAITQSGPRIVVFRVSGTIDFTGFSAAPTINDPFITIAGQTAPGDGITLKGKELVIRTHDVIVRGLRMRIGDENGNRDSFRITSTPDSIAQNIIIDHCSMSWGLDENASAVGNSTDITFSWNIISEGLLGAPPRTQQSFGLLVGKDGPGNISVHHNLFAHNRSRSPKFARAVTGEIINNTVYDYGSRATILNGEVRANLIGNYYIPGDSTLGFPDSPPKGIQLVLETLNGDSVGDPLVYVQGNIGPGRETDQGDEWAAVDGDSAFQSLVPALAGSGISVQPALQAYNLLLANAGVVVPKRDPVDERVLADVTDRTGGLIVSQGDVGGWPVLNPAAAPTDTDNDGMPDVWELVHGLNINIDDSAGDRDGDGYTNIEEYINQLIPRPFAPSTPQLVFPADSLVDTDSTLTLTWHPADSAESYLVKIFAVTDTAVLVFSDSAITDTFATVQGLEQNRTHLWYVRASGNGLFSPISRIQMFTTRAFEPAQVGLFSPADSAIDQPTTITLTWNPVQGADFYHLQVSTSSDFGQLFFEDSTLILTSQRFENFDNGVTYYWRVRAINPVGPGLFSPTWHFTTVVNLPGQVQLISPADFSTFALDTLVFRWRSTQPAIEKYSLEIADDSLMANILFDLRTSDTTRAIGNNVLLPKPHWWRVRAKNAAGWGPYSGIRKLIIVITGIKSGDPVPTQFALSQNYPNPFNPTTNIRFALASRAQVSLKVFDILGREVVTLLAKELAAGEYVSQFDASALPSGVYYYRLEAVSNDGGTFRDVKKLLLIK